MHIHTKKITESFKQFVRIKENDREMSESIKGFNDLIDELNRTCSRSIGKKHFNFERKV
jgi:hypothetical protein